jgi:hypothetical protein
LVTLYTELGPLLEPGNTEREDQKVCYQKAISLLLDNITKNPKAEHVPDYRSLIASTCDTYASIENDYETRKAICNIGINQLTILGIPIPHPSLWTHRVETPTSPCQHGR